MTDNARGAVFMSLSMAGFVVNDTLVKVIAPDLGFFQLIFLRGLMATALIAALAARARAFSVMPGPRDRKVIGLRTIGELGATACFLTALFNMPLANATAILQSAPLAITLAAAAFLGEPIGWRRIGAIVAGFGGVLMIVRPGAEGFTAYSLMALTAVGFVVLRDLTTRRLSRSVPSLLVTFSTSVAVTGGAGAAAAFLPWPPVTGEALGLLAAAAVALIVGYLFGVMAMREGEIGFVSPFRYTVLLWAILLGLAVFGDVPDAMTISGALLIAGMGIYTFRRERKLARAAAAARAAEARITPPRTI